MSWENSPHLLIFSLSDNQSTRIQYNKTLDESKDSDKNEELVEDSNVILDNEIAESIPKVNFE